MFIKLSSLFLFVLLFALSACGAETEESDESALAQAVAEGMLLPFEESLMEVQPELGVVERRTLTESSVRTAVPFFFTQRELRFEAANRTLAGIYVEWGQRVKAGDVLAELEPLDPELTEHTRLRQRGAQVDLERFERDFAIERNRRLNDLAQIRLDLERADADEWPRLALQRDRQEVNYNQFLLNSEQTRQRLTNQLQDLNRQLQGDQIIAPFDGVIIWVMNHRSRMQVDGHPPIMRIAAEDSLFFSFTLPNTDLILSQLEMLAMLRFGDIFTVTMLWPPHEHIRYDFDVRVANDPWTTGSRANMRYVLEPLDRDALIAAFEEYEVDLAMQGSQTIPTFFFNAVSQVEDTLAVPALAIHTINNVSHVYVYEDGLQRMQYVILGARCSESGWRYREVLDGLREGELVVIQPR